MLAFIDCFKDSPANSCFNQFILNNQIPATYHMVSRFGFDSLEPIANHSAFIILGSASHVSENLEWHRKLEIFIHDQLLLKKPVLGICFGHQLIAKYFGSEIGSLYSDNSSSKELRELTIVQNFHGHTKDQKISLAYAHEQVITKLSDEFEILATSSKSEFEIIRHKKLPFIGTQAHPEASPSFFQNELKIPYPSEQNQGNNFILNFLRMYHIL